MKSFLIILSVIFLITPLFAAEKSSKVKNQNAKTQGNIKLVENYVAIFDLETQGKIDKGVIRSLSESIMLEIRKAGRYEIIDRGNMNKILGEQKFQLSGCVGECRVEAGQLLGVGKIVTGTLNLIGKTYHLTLSLINVETGKVEFSEDESCKCEIDDLIDLSKRIAKRLMGEVVEIPATVTKPNTVIPNNLTALEYYSKGNDYQKKQKDADKAIEYYQKAISVDPNHENALFQLGYIYSDKEEYKKSIEYYMRAYNINPKAQDTPNNIGLAYSKAGDYENAEKWYRKSLEIDPNYTLALNGLGLVYHKKKQYSEAELWYKKTIQVDPKYYLAYYNLGKIYEDLKEYSESIDYYKKAISINPQYVNAMINIGLVYETAKKDYGEAGKWYQKAIFEAPNEPIGYYNIGFIYSNKKSDLYDRDKAIEAWKKAASLGKIEAKKALKEYYNIDY